MRSRVVAKCALFAVVQNSRFHCHSSLAGKSVGQAAALVPKVSRARSFMELHIRGQNPHFPQWQMMANKFWGLHMAWLPSEAFSTSHK